MKILLTGATGFLGYRTLERLIQDESISEIIASGRTIKSTHEISHPKVTYVLGDLSNADFVADLVLGCDVVIHAAALSSPWGKKADFESANVTSQLNLIQSSKANKVRRYIYISTPSIYFDYTDKLNISEKDALPSSFVNDYSRTKFEAEKLLIKSSIPYIILRPRALTGRGDTVIMPRLIKAQQAGRLKIIGDGKNTADLTSVSNVADVIYNSIHSEEESLNEDYNITNGEPVILWDTIHEVLTKLDLNPTGKKVGYKLVKFIAALMELSAKVIGKNEEPTITKYGVGTLAKSMTFDISKAQRSLNYQPKVSTQDAIQEFVDWHKSNESNTTVSK
ncbi:MAG: nucleoside-diphosphate-sugar epimerase [Cryomorphaceae bacterium]|jgi:nucleoside-diphosphate-sugar epimerase